MAEIADPISIAMLALTTVIETGATVGGAALSAGAASLGAAAKIGAAGLGAGAGIAGEVGGILSTHPFLTTVGLGAGGAAAAKNMGGDFRPPTPVGKVEQVEGSIEAQAEKEQKRRLKHAAAVMLKDWEPPVLGTPGMLGV